MRGEDRLQVRCAMLCTSHVSKDVFWTAIEHGRQHKGTGTQRASEWQRLARKGVKTGLPDLLFIMPGYVLAVELKTQEGVQSDTQKATQTKLQAMGMGYQVVRSVEGLGEAFEAHGIPITPGWRVAAMRHDAALDTPPKGHNKPPRAPAKPRGNRKQVARWNTAMLAMAKGPSE